GGSGGLVGGPCSESGRVPGARRLRGAACPGGWCFRASGSGGHCLGGTSTGSSGELPGAISSSWCSTFPGVRRSRGLDVPGGGVPRRAVFPGEREWGALPGRDEHRRSEERRVGKEGGTQGRAGRDNMSRERR